MSDDVFAQGDKSGDEGTALEQLVGEGKKYSTVEDLAKSRLEADAHIETLEGEAKLTRDQLAELQAAKDKGATLTELVAAVKEANKEGDGKEGDKPLTEEALTDMVKQIMQGTKATETKEANRSAANAAVLQKLDGNVEAARAYVAEVAEKHGMTVEQVQTLGEDSPSAFRALMGIDQVPAHQGDIKNISGHQPPADTTMVIDGHKTKAYYDAQKREMGAVKYWADDALQKAYYADAFALGERFNQ